MGSRLYHLAAMGEWKVKKSARIDNKSNLSILPAGRCDKFTLYMGRKGTFSDQVTFHQLGEAASYWLEDIETEKGALHWHLGYPIGEHKSAMHRHHIIHDIHRFSVRCVCEKSRSGTP